MRCQNCGKPEVSYMYTQNINGVKKEVRLCQECAEKLGLIGGNVVTDIDIDSFIEELFSNGTLRDLSNAIDQAFDMRIDKSIPSYEEFTNNRLFDKEGIYPGLKRRNDINEKNEEKEVSQERQDKKEDNKNLSKREKLELEMKKAVEIEDYETAAKIRDELKELKD